MTSHEEPLGLGSEESARNPSNSGPPGNRTIVLVEDEARLRLLFRSVLIGPGYTLLEASNGAEAFRLCREHGGRIDLLVSDIHLPGMSGQEVARRLLGIYPALKVLFVSGSPLQEGERLFPEGAAFMDKPFTITNLAARVAELLAPEAQE